LVHTGHLVVDTDRTENINALFLNNSDKNLED
jgi:hypothetical protein